MEQLTEYEIYVALAIILVISILYTFYTEVAVGNAKKGKLGFLVWFIKDMFFPSKPDSTGSPSGEEKKDAAGGND